MTKNYKILPGKPYPFGVNLLANGDIQFAMPFNQTECGMIIYKKNKDELLRVSFSDATRVGNVFCGVINGIKTDDCCYRLYEDEQIFMDPYAKLVIGNEKFSNEESEIYAGFVNMEYDWQGDFCPAYAYEESILYLMHTRGFTKHTSSGVSKKGTVEGIVEKIPYLKELGVTAVELMPSYEFIEWEKTVIDEKIPLAYQQQKKPINYWGYKNAYYFAPKYSYCAGKNPVKSFKDFVSAMHKEGLEVIMQFYFPNEVKSAYITSVIEYWVNEYHIDGVHLMGECIPVNMLCDNPILARTKLFYYDFSINDLARNREGFSYKNLGICNDSFMYDMRKFLKSDENMLTPVLNHMKNVSDKTGNVHYITQSNGFTLADLVSYDRKHNEENGENNRDGNPYNASWNCGVEGKTKKKGILTLRQKQMKNAFVLNLLSLGTPMILAGDEFGNSQNGNNNAYCHDNAVTWLNWKNIEKNNDLFNFVKELIAFRKKQVVFTREEQFKMSDYLSCGYPDLSYHGEEAWKIQTDHLTRQFGALYCAKYASGQDKVKEDVYLAVNMHWNEHEFALPNPIDGKKWYIIMDTEDEKGFLSEPVEVKEKSILAKERSIRILLCK